MSNLEKFVYKTTGKNLSEVGTVSIEIYAANKIIATRPFLNGTGSNPRRRRASPSIPEGIMINGSIFFVDGHHKASFALSDAESAMCRVLQTEDQIIIDKVQRIATLPIQELQRR